MRKLMFFMPIGAWLSAGTHNALCRMSKARSPFKLHKHKDGSAVWSFYQGGYNHCNAWCSVLNRRAKGVTDAACMHTDVEPVTPYFLNKLWEARAKKKADVCAAIVPLKDDTQTSGVAIKHKFEDGYFKVPLKDFKGMPPVFDVDDFAPGGNHIMVPTTGLWLCDVTKPWAEDCDFVCLGGKAKDEKGLWQPYFFSEDYYEFTKLSIIGVKICFTKEIIVNHWGDGKADNRGML